MDVHSPCGRDYAVIDEAIDGGCAALARGAGRGSAVVSIIVHSPARSFRVYGGLKHPGKPHRVGPSLRFESGVNQFKPICGTVPQRNPYRVSASSPWVGLNVTRLNWLELGTKG
jgi:hypothetical protein